MNEEKKAEYEEKTRQKWESRGEQEWGWSEVAEVLVKTVEEVCGLGNRGGSESLDSGEGERD